MSTPSPATWQWPEPVVGEDVRIATPPTAAEDEPQGRLAALLPAASSVGMVGFALLSGSITFLVLSGVLVVVGCGVPLLSQRQRRQWRARREADRRDRYLRYLERIEAQLARGQLAQQRQANALYPTWPAVRDAARRGRQWLRRSGDPDFGVVRVGTGRVPSVSRVTAEPVPVDAAGDDLAESARSLATRYSAVDDMPVTIDAGRGLTVLQAGSSQKVLARRMAAHALAMTFLLHHPDDFAVTMSVPAAAAHDYDWCRLAPHVSAMYLDGDRPPAPQPGSHLPDARRPGREPRHHMRFIDRLTGGQDADPTPDPADDLGSSGIDSGMLLVVPADVAVPAGASSVLRLDGEGCLWVRQGSAADPSVLVARPETISPAEAAAACSVLPPRARTAERATCPTAPELSALLARVNGPGPRRLAVPFGQFENGAVAILNLAEAAEGGAGPHGLLVGATGSGKSELLRTLVCGLAATHTPDELRMVLIDYKGGTAFAALESLPHVAGFVTNLLEGEGLIERMQAALAGELRRRQELLRDAGVGCVADYGRLRANGEKRALPALLLVVDEFAELLAARPELVDLFVRVGRIGRGLGVHLLLAAQRLDEGRLRALEPHLRFRLCLRTFTAAESHAVVGSAAAYELPAQPGVGLLCVDGRVQRFRASLAGRLAPATSGPAAREAVCGRPGVEEPASHPAATEPAASHPAATEPASPRPAPREPASIGGDGAAAGAALRPVSGPNPLTWLKQAAGELHAAGQAPVARSALSPAFQGPRPEPIILPPLPRVLTLDRLLTTPARALRDATADGSATHEIGGGLEAPVGLLDLPFEHAQRVFSIAVGGREGHVAAVGSAGSGRTTLLRTFITSLALTSDPADIAIFVLDTSGALANTTELPHVADVAGADDPERIAAVLAELVALCDLRTAWSRSRQIPDAARYLRVGPRAPGDRFARVVLAVDDVGQLRARLPGIDPLLVDVGMRGTRAGIHLVLTCSKWAELRGGLREGITHRLEFALADPTESELPRHRALQLHRESLPGRACLADGRLLQVALPRFSQPMSNGQRGWSAVTAMARRVKGDRHRPVTLLPSALPLPPSEPSADGLLVGVRAPDLEAVRLDPSGEEGHLLVLGDARSGRSSLLRAIITQVRRRCRAAPLTLWVVDPRGSLHTAATCKVTDTAASSGPKVPVTRREELTYARTASEVQAVADALSAVLTRSRTAATELAIAPAAPSESRGWGGEPGKPLHVLIVDDHDLVLGPASTALAGLATHLPYAVENGLRLVLVRRVTGYSRAAYDPIVSALRELGAPGLVLSGDPLEGPVLYGARAERRPPGRGALLRVDGSQVTLQVAAFPSPDHTDQQLGSADKPR